MTEEKTDVKLTLGDGGYYDMTLGNDGDFEAVFGFDTSIQISLFCERRASEDQVPNVRKRRGWLGNEAADEPGFEIGSLIWLWASQARNTADTRNALRDASKDSLEWLVDDKYLNDLQASAVLEPDGAAIFLNLVRKNGKIDKLYFKLWELTGF